MKHVDTNTDTKCDNCGVCMHRDADDDDVCDYCNQSFSDSCDTGHVYNPGSIHCNKCNNKKPGSSLDNKGAPGYDDALIWPTDSELVISCRVHDIDLTVLQALGYYHGDTFTAKVDTYALAVLPFDVEGRGDIYMVRITMHEGYEEYINSIVGHPDSYVVYGDDYVEFYFSDFPDYVYFEYSSGGHLTRGAIKTIEVYTDA